MCEPLIAEGIVKDQGKGWRWWLQVIVLPIILALIGGGYVLHRSADVPPGNSANAHAPASDEKMTAIAELASRTIAGNWTLPGIECEYARSIAVDGNNLLIYNSDPTQSLAGRYRMYGLRGNRIETDDAGVTAEFWRDGDDLMYQRAGSLQRFDRCTS